jgi:hypothetical protein
LTVKYAAASEPSYEGWDKVGYDDKIVFAAS